MKKLIIFLALALCAALAGCNQPAPSQGSDPPQEPSGSVSTSPMEKPDEPASTTDEQTATLYIGTKARGFTEYPMTYEGELTPDALDIWYFMEREKPLELPGLGLSCRLTSRINGQEQKASSSAKKDRKAARY